MLSIIFISTAALMLFFYFRDNNREPPERLAEAFIIGTAISLQVGWIQARLPEFGIFFTAFVSAGFVEEAVKLAALQVSLFRSRYFTARIDGITYAVFLSLGFSLAENLVHVQALEVGIARAFTATPAHALFGVAMGFYVGRFKFSGRKALLLLALLVPAGLHGLYNYLIMSGTLWGLLAFTPYVGFLWYLGTFKHDKLKKKVRRRVQKDKKVD